MIIYTRNKYPPGFYVYAWFRLDGTPYYIGKGRGSRLIDKHHRFSPPTDHNRIRLLEANLTELGAFALERRYIRWYGRTDIGTGILRNMSDGGEGNSNPSTETRRKISVARKARRGLYRHTEVTRKKIGRSGTSNSQYGKRLSTEEKLALSKSRKEKSHNKGMVLVYDIEEKIFRKIPKELYLESKNIRYITAKTASTRHVLPYSTA